MKASNYRGSRKLILDSIKGESKIEKIINPTKFVLRAPRKEGIPLQTPKLQQQFHQQSQSKNRQTFYQKETREGEYTESNQQYLQARDRRRIVKYPFREKVFDIDKQKQHLQEWLGEMHFKVVSASFNLYLSNQLTFEQVKVHCCQNLLLNILNFLQTLTPNSDNSVYSVRNQVESLNHHQMSKILKHINETLVKNLQYMQIKYPLTKDSKPNKSLQSLLTKINNLGNDEHDIVMKSKVQFHLKQKGNYTAEIMKLINFLISKQGQLCGVKGSNNKQLNYFQYFYQVMEKIFTSIYKPQNQEKESDQNVNTQQQKKQQEKKEGDSVTPQTKKQAIKKDQTTEETLTKEQKQYKQKVQKYTHFLIGKKISSNTQLYTEKEMQTQIFDVRNSSILRILTKWTEQLQKKILTAQEQILKRPYRFKRNQETKSLPLTKQQSGIYNSQKRQYKQTHKQFSKLNSNQKNDLFQQANRKAKQVNSFREQLTQSYNQIQSMLSSHLKQGPELRHIPKNEYKIGFFCSKIQAAASSTLLSYLNKIIHILLLIPAELRKRHAHDEEYMQNININLITFKISDLFRCKIKSREAQIIRIFKQIKAMSQKGDIFKIVRIKDRLNQGTRDIMINILFKEIFLCEIQLAIEEYVQTKQLSYDSFSHFLYEMHRSRLGPIMESACTWAQFDQRVKIYREINDSSKQVKNIIKHECDKELFVTNQYPFVCTLCQKFYSTQVGLIEHKKCLQCKAYYVCSVCIYRSMTEKEILDLLNLDDILKDFSNDFRLWSFDGQQQSQQKHRKLPQFGLIISKQMKKPQIIFFQTIIFKYDAYIIHIKYNQTLRDTELIIIQKIYGNSQKKIRQVAEKYIIFEWKEEKAINKTLMPSSMKQQIDAQKKQKQQALAKKKKEKEQKKKQLEKKRREEQQKLGRFFKKQEKDKQASKQQKQNEKQQQKSVCSQSSQDEKKCNYNYNIFQANQNVEVRVMQKQKQNAYQVLLLGAFLKEYDIRNQLKKMNNKNILQRLSKQKVEVLFMEDQFIEDQINNADQLTSIELQQLKQTFQRIIQAYFDNNRINNLAFLELMTNLKVAHFSNNYIDSMEYFENLTEITEIILQNNQITLINNINNKSHLIDLNLNRNWISQLYYFDQLQQGELSNLTNLYLNGNHLQSMAYLGKLVNLVKLDLSFNKITQIQPTPLLNLQQLDLSSNKITKMKGVSSFANLRKLSLNKNLIKVISKEITKFTKLTHLNISDNRIKKIQNLNTGNFTTTLKVLNLSQNRIQAMKGLQNLQKLEQLYLNDNQIQSINQNYLQLVNLTILDLSYNSIQQLNLNAKELKTDLQKLRIFNISSNIINDTKQNRYNLELINEIFQYNYVMFK